MSVAARPLERRAPESFRRAPGQPNHRSEGRSSRPPTSRIEPAEPASDRTRTHLRAVPRRRHFTPALAGVLALVFTGMLALTVFEIHMAQHQVQIDRINLQLDQARVDQQDLLRQRAELTSVQRLGAQSAALGMVQAAGVGFVTVDAATVAAVVAGSGRLHADAGTAP